MYYRRKIIYGLLEKFGRPLSNTELQKLLFLLSKYPTEKKTYDFVPYHYGCYSFQLNDDLNAMYKREMINKEEKDKQTLWSLIKNENYFYQLKDTEKKSVLSIRRQFQNKSIKEIIKYIYITYPFYAMNSVILDKTLNEEEQVKILEQKSRIKKEETQLFTIGYEGITLEVYLNRLIKNDVKVLCDVRKNPKSMKRGFSKRELEKACLGLGIEYKHIPNLGIISEKRKKLKTQEDYNTLFSEYENTVIKDNLKEISYLSSLLGKYQRIALTCFEAKPCMCHRERVAQQIEINSDGEYKIKHL